MAVESIKGQGFRGLPRGRSRLPRAEVQRAQRRRILHSIIEAVAEKGFAAVTVTEVVARARVSRSSFYAQFGDKEACFVAASGEGRRRLFAHVRRAARRAAGADVDELRLRASLHAYLDFLNGDPAYARVFYVEWLGVRGGAQKLASARDDFAAMTAAWHARARRRHPGWPEVPAPVYRALTGATEELVREQVQAGKLKRLLELEDVLVGLHLRVLTDMTWQEERRWISA
jgi:AcrR family transcriptional regulator